MLDTKHSMLMLNISSVNAWYQNAPEDLRPISYLLVRGPRFEEKTGLENLEQITLPM